MKLFAICLFIISCSQISNQEEIYQLEGTWKVEGKEQFEAWSIIEGSLKGEGYKIEQGVKVITETLLITQESGDWIYSATVPNQNQGKTIPFQWNKEETDKLSFENNGHDFPKKIQYQFLSSTEVLVNVLGEGDTGFNFKMIKQD